MARFRDFLVGFLAAVGALFLPLLVLLLGLGYVLYPGGEPDLPDRVYLTVDLRGGLDEAAAPDPFAFLDGSDALTLDRAVLGLEAAAADPRVAGLFARVDGESGGPAQAREIRDALAKLRAAGKFAIAHAESFGEFGPGTSGYWLASGFEEISVQPLGAVGLTGLWAEVPLIRGLLDRIGIVPRLEAREAYKTFRNTFTERELTPAHREMLQSLTGDLGRQLVADVAAERQLPAGDVRAAIDAAPLFADEAKLRGLIDAVRYLDEAEAAAEARAGEGAVAVPLEAYAAGQAGLGDGSGPAVAYIQALGPIHEGAGGPGGLGGFSAGADTVVDALDAAREDADIQAVLFRVDSPGGSAVASNRIGRAVRRLKEAGKPVLVAMGEVAASGGYWIAMDADAIYARPGTITGSIGVVAGKPVVAPLLDDLGVNVPGLGVGANADMWSLARDFDAAGRARLDAFLDRTYAAFVDGVARGRGLDRAQVLEIAGGRVWTGAQAREHGLVDGLGGLAEALADLRDRLGATPDAPLRIVRLPEAPGPLELARKFLNVRAHVASWLRSMIGASGPVTAPSISLF